MILVFLAAAKSVGTARFGLEWLLCTICKTSGACFLSAVHQSVASFEKYNTGATDRQLYGFVSVSHLSQRCGSLPFLQLYDFVRVVGYTASSAVRLCERQPLEPAVRVLAPDAAADERREVLWVPLDARELAAVQHRDVDPVPVAAQVRPRCPIAAAAAAAAAPAEKVTVPAESRG